MTIKLKYQSSLKTVDNSLNSEGIKISAKTNFLM